MIFLLFNHLIHSTKKLIQKKNKSFKCVRANYLKLIINFYTFENKTKKTDLDPNIIYLVSLVIYLLNKCFLIFQ